MDKTTTFSYSLSVLVLPIPLLVDSKTTTKQALLCTNGRWTHQCMAHSHSLFRPIAHCHIIQSCKWETIFFLLLGKYAVALWLMEGYSSYLWPFWVVILPFKMPETPLILVTSTDCGSVLCSPSFLNESYQPYQIQGPTSQVLPIWQ